MDRLQIGSCGVSGVSALHQGPHVQGLTPQGVQPPWPILRWPKTTKMWWIQLLLCHFQLMDSLELVLLHGQQRHGHYQATWHFVSIPKWTIARSSATKQKRCTS